MGFGTALLLSRSEFHTSNMEKLPLQVVQLDVNDDRSVKDAIHNIDAEKGRIDVLINNAGYGLFGSLEDLSIEEIKAQFETNFFGVVCVTQKVIPIMRKQNLADSLFLKFQNILTRNLKE
jgi:NADP-dependent 3-hydroxy acid dehydrogenase YdfG